MDNLRHVTKKQLPMLHDHIILKYGLIAMLRKVYAKPGPAESINKALGQGEDINKSYSNLGRLLLGVDNKIDAIATLKLLKISQRVKQMIIAMVEFDAEFMKNNCVALNPEGLYNLIVEKYKEFSVEYKVELRVPEPSWTEYHITSMNMKVRRTEDAYIQYCEKGAIGCNSFCGCRDGIVDRYKCAKIHGLSTLASLSHAAGPDKIDSVYISEINEEK